MSQICHIMCIHDTSSYLACIFYWSRGELDPDEYEEVQKETVEQLKEFQASLSRMSAGDMTLVNNINAMQLVSSKSHFSSPSQLRVQFLFLFNHVLPCLVPVLRLYNISVVFLHVGYHVLDSEEDIDL